MRVGQILECHNVRAFEKQLTHSSAGQRTPQLGWKKKRQRSAWTQQLTRSFDEERREVDLRCESASGAGRARTAFPGGVAIYCEVPFQPVARCLRDVMNTHPGRITDDHIESSGSGHIGEVRGKGEWERCAGAQSLRSLRVFSETRPDGGETDARLPLGSVTVAKQVPAAQCDQDLSTLGA